MPQFSDHITPSWLAKFMAWRRSHNADNVLLLSPNSNWVDCLRDRGTPDRSDFHRYGNNNTWHIRVLRETPVAAEDLADVIAEWVYRQDCEHYLKRIE
jgi:hypothetical protein